MIGNIVLVAVCLILIMTVVLQVKGVLVKEPKWQQVYFYLVKESHASKYKHWMEIQRGLISRYKLTVEQANLCIDHAGESSDWFEKQDWLK